MSSKKDKSEEPKPRPDVTPEVASEVIAFAKDLTGPYPPISVGDIEKAIGEVAKEEPQAPPERLPEMPTNFDCDCGRGSCKGLTKEQVTQQHTKSPALSRVWNIRKGNKRCYELVSKKIAQLHHPKP